MIRTASFLMTASTSASLGVKVRTVSITTTTTKG